MRILYITGPNENHAIDFEKNFTIQQIVDEIMNQENPRVWLEFEEPGRYYFLAKIFEFKDVDPAFIEFIKDNIEDYNLSKTSNFYVIED